MLNLLPPEAKEALHREYLLRFLLLLFVCLTSAVMVGVIVSFPYNVTGVFDYLAIHGQGSTTPYELTDEDKAVTKTLETFKAQLSVLDPRKMKDQRLLTSMIRAITMEKPSTIILTSFSFFAEDEAHKRIVLSGVAETRESLAAFSKHLSENSMFSSVDLPVSNLSKKSEIDFSITLSTKAASTTATKTTK